ncbi:MAG: NPCBM/NEW2 domain-containing protein, partial [Candidatus Hydrogenedentes bacterium]|nr:NPCBM/NEW2 domain-containing protein [Candidatus Hydrogenedentota bacterium]
MTLVKLLCIGCWVASAAIADDFDAALPQSEFNDSLMATPEELQDLRQWAAAAFAGTAPVNPEAVTLNVLRQDHSVLGFGQSCIDTPIRIGTKTYEHGLGTHAHSMIGVVAPAGAQRFQAAVGIDNNDDTLGTRGSADFIVESLGRQLFRSATVHGGEEAVSVDVELNASMPSIKLIVDATADGVSHDQADWADARFVMADGSVRWLDEHQSRLLFLNTEVPFSFNYGGASSHDLLKDWSREVSTETREDRTNYHVSWKDAKTGLTVSAEAAVYTGYPAVDWVLYFENQGTEDTPLLEDIRALDVHLRTGYQRHPAVLHELNGDACGENTFLPKTTSLYASEKLHLAPTGGRSSSISAFPFFNFGYGNQGLIAAIGWTGQWAADFDRAEAGPTRLRAGMEHTRLR